MYQINPYWGAGLTTPASPGTGSVVATGLVPSVYMSQVAQPGAGSIAVVGKTPGWPLVVEILFEDGNGESTQVLNTGTAGPTYFLLGAPGMNEQVTTSDSYEGSGSLVRDDVWDAQGRCVTDVFYSDLQVATADFQIEIAIKKTAAWNSRYGHNFWGNETGAAMPFLYLDAATENLGVAYAGTTHDLGFVPTHSAWHKYRLKRASGVLYVYYDDMVTEIWSVADTTSYTPTGRFTVGCSGNFAAAVAGGKLDSFRFWNGNV